MKRVAPLNADRPPLLSSPALHYDIYGSLAHVMHMIGAEVPRLFPEEAPHVIQSLKDMVEKHARDNSWDLIAVSLSKGLARAELEDIINKDTPHHGPLIIDPTAHSPEHEVFASEALLAARKERLIAVNEKTGDILIIIYGLTNVSAQTQRQLLMKRMRILGLAVEKISEELDGMALRHPQQSGHGFLLLKKHVARLRQAKERLKTAHGKMGMGQESQADLENEDRSAELFIALATLHMLMQETDDPRLLATLNGIGSQILSIPTHFEGAGVTFASFENLAENMAARHTHSITAPDTRADGDGHMERLSSTHIRPAPR